MFEDGADDGRVLDAADDKSLVNELLTETEVGELRSYLAAKHGVDVQVEEAETPIRRGASAHSCWPLFRGEASYNLYLEDGCNLTVPIAGRADLRYCPPTAKLGPKRLERGVRFLETALERLGIDTFVEAGQLTAVLHRPSQRGLSGLQELIEALYDDTGLFVQQGQSRAQRERARQALLEEQTKHTVMKAVPRNQESIQ